MNGTSESDQVDIEWLLRQHALSPRPEMDAGLAYLFATIDAFAQRKWNPHDLDDTLKRIFPELRAPYGDANR